MPDEQQVNTAGQLVNKDIATVFEQAQVAYTTLAETPGKACANCIFFRDTGYDGIEYQHCAIVSAYPDPILPTGICNHWEAKPEPPAGVAGEVADAVTEAVVEAVETISDSMAMMEMESKPKGLLQRAKDALFPSKPMSSFEVFKGNDGQWYFIAKHTNRYEDRDKEILSEKSHEAYIKRLDMGLVDMPELWTWHMGSKTKHGQADQVFGIGGIVVAVGHFDDTPMAKKAIEYYRKNRGNIALSHGFTAPTWAFHDGIYDVYNTFEISTLPKEVASNPYTSFEEIKAMQPNPKKLDWVEGVLGKDVRERLESETAAQDKALQELGVNYKDFADVTGDATPATPAQAKEGEMTMAKAFVELVEGQGEFVKLFKAMTAKQDAMQKTISGYEQEVKDLRALVNAGPRRPVTDSATEVTDPAELAKAKALLSNEAQEFKDRWGVPMKPAEGTNGNGHG